MQLGFNTAILGGMDLEEVLVYAGSAGYDCIEVMCWPVGKAERRYAGVTHIDVNNFGEQEATHIHRMSRTNGVEISALGYYPNPLTPDKIQRGVYIDHIRKVIDASQILGVGKVNTFVGRDPGKSVDENWLDFLEVWTDLIQYAEEREVKIGIENCPMLFTDDEWPGGHNLATSPAIWNRMFEAIPSDCFGLNYDPSHLIWQHMDYLGPIREFASRFFHVHAKDVRIDRQKLDRVGIMAPPNAWHTPKLPGMGDVNWGMFFSELTSAGYEGPVCVEVEDRAYEGSLNRAIMSLDQSYTYLRQFVPKER